MDEEKQEQAAPASKKKKRKRRSAMRFVAAAFFLAVFAYLGVYLYRAIGTPLRTVTAVSYTLYDSVQVNGLLLRDETVLRTSYDIVYTVPDEGARVAVGGEVAVAYGDSESLSRAEEARRLTLEIEQLQALREAKDESSDLAHLDTTLREDVLALREAAERRELREIQDRMVELRALAFNRDSGTERIDAQISELQLRLHTLGSETSNRAATVTAPVSGLFSTLVDGWESVTPEQVMQMDAQSFTELLEEGRQAPEGAVGKLVTGVRWYFAAVVPSEKAADYALGDPVELIFGRFYSEQLEMTVAAKNEDYAGSCLLVLACDSALRDTLPLRLQSAELVQTTYTGIRIPKSTLRLDEEGQTFVYVETGLRAERKDVEILQESGEYYIVADNAGESGALRPGDSVIVSGKDIYDGKVVR